MRTIIALDRIKSNIHCINSRCMYCKLMGKPLGGEITLRYVQPGIIIYVNHSFLLLYYWIIPL